MITKSELHVNLSRHRGYLNLLLELPIIYTVFSLSREIQSHLTHICKASNWIINQINIYLLQLRTYIYIYISVCYYLLQCIYIAKGRELFIDTTGSFRVFVQMKVSMLSKQRMLDFPIGSLNYRLLWVGCTIFQIPIC